MAEDIVDSWEDLEDNGELDKQLKNLVPSQSNSKGSIKESDGVVPTVLKLQDDNGGRTAYKPSVRILKREPNAASLNNSAASASSTQSRPIRTLEEREAAYAEARLRILGSVETPQESNVNNIETTSDASGSAAVGRASLDPANSPVQTQGTTKNSSSSAR